MTRPMLFPAGDRRCRALILACGGCSGEAEDTTTLDSVLTRTESLVDAEQGPRSTSVSPRAT